MVKSRRIPSTDAEAKQESLCEILLKLQSEFLLHRLKVAFPRRLFSSPLFTDQTKPLSLSRSSESVLNPPDTLHVFTVWLLYRIRIMKAEKVFFFDVFLQKASHPLRVVPEQNGDITMT